MSKNQEFFSKEVETTINVGTLFIGGGPATLGVLTHAYQINKQNILCQLISDNRVQDVANECAIIETSDQLGGGNLQQYFGIRSNTSTHGFLKVIQFAKPKKKKVNSNNNDTQSVIKKKEYSTPGSSSYNYQISSQQQSPFKSPSLKIQVISSQAIYKDNNDQEKQSQYSTTASPTYIPFLMPAFLQFAKNDIVTFIKQTGKSIGPLQIIGSFLSFVDGTYTTTIEKYSFEVIKEDKVVKLIPKIVIVNFNSVNVVFATGGKQNVPKTFHKKFELNKSIPVFTSDELLRERKFKQLLEIIKTKGKDIQIVIIGGSHSAFSIAWLLLNGPSQLKNFQTQPQQISNCAKCISCPLNLTHLSSQPCICQQQCKCISVPRIPSAYANEINDITFPCISKQSSVKILYRDKIKVYYTSQVMAQADQYTDYDQRQDVSKSGIVFPFTGLRGDAKELWRKIKTGQENRIELIRADTQIEQKAFAKQADVIIIATGYKTNHIPVYDPQGNKIKFKRLASNKQSTYEVDQSCQIFPAGPCGRSFDGLYGIGIGYSLKTTDNLVQAEQKLNTKADSVGLYVKQIGHKLLPQILNNLRTSKGIKNGFLSVQGTSQNYNPLQTVSTTLHQSNSPFFVIPTKILPSTNPKQQSQEAYYDIKETQLYQYENMRLNNNPSSSLRKTRQSYTVLSQQQQNGVRANTATSINNRQAFDTYSSEQKKKKQKDDKKIINEVNQYYHRSPEVKKSKLLIGQSISRGNGPLLASTLTTPFTKIVLSQNTSTSHQGRKQDKIINGYTPLREKSVHIHKGSQLTGNWSLRYNQAYYNQNGSISINDSQQQYKIGRKLHYKH